MSTVCLLSKPIKKSKFSKSGAPGEKRTAADEGAHPACHLSATDYRPTLLDFTPFGLPQPSDESPGCIQVIKLETQTKAKSLISK